MVLISSDAQELQQMSIDGSQNTSGVLPPLGAPSSPLAPLGHPSSRRGKLRNLIISPYDRGYRFWETYLAALVLFYTAWASPFEFGFLERPERPFSIIDNIVNGFFAIDIILTFFVAYLDKSKHVDNQKQIAWRYASTWLLFDVVSTIPSELAGYISIGSFKSYGLINILRLLRWRRVNPLFARLEKDIKFNYIFVRRVMLIYVTLFVQHCAGCIYYKLAAMYPNPGRTWIGYDNLHFKDQSLWERYLTSLYWSMTTLGGAGNADAKNNLEMLFIICYMLSNFVLLAHLMGNMTNMAVRRSSETMQFRNRIEAALRHAQRNELPDSLRDKMLEHFYKTNSEVLREQEIVNLLPKSIILSISYTRFSPVLKKANLFSGVSDDSLLRLVSIADIEYFHPKEDIILQKFTTTDFYIVLEGAVELLVVKNGVEQIVGEAKAGDICGETAVLPNKPQVFTVRAKESSQLLRLNRTAIVKYIGEANIDDVIVIMINFLTHLKDNKADPLMLRVLFETVNMLAGVFLAIFKDDDRSYDTFLRKCLDLEEVDNNGRSDLHMTMIKGSRVLAHLLLEHGADLRAEWAAIEDSLNESNINMVKSLSDHGFNIDEQHPDGENLNITP